MNISQQAGESSSNRQENGDNTAEIERPLKKARFAWQVKGKYHLKDESNNKKSYPNAESPQDTMFPIPSDNEIATCTMGEQHFDAIEDFMLNSKLSKLDPVPDTENTTEFTEFTLLRPVRGGAVRVGSFELFLFVPRSCCAPT
ncbi:hypothetical protein EVAR_2758_1 [Eumeta japonica]|uniref:Uncharacterized protein n=1 Tax=Eumeta variegata TaxID=151549 RepID=A0A4C1SZE9_EUMVA|nr:hypothetical protein EVAR_2758_1 [Eumeta japonica]